MYQRRAIGWGQDEEEPLDVEEDEEDQSEDLKSSSNEVDDDVAFRSSPSIPSVVSAMMPSQPQSESESSSSSSNVSVDDEAGDDIEPVPVPRKTVVKKKVLPLKK